MSYKLHLYPSFAVHCVLCSSHFVVLFAAVFRGFLVSPTTMATLKSTENAPSHCFLPRKAVFALHSPEVFVGAYDDATLFRKHSTQSWN
jgi:hypothetical protein